MYFHNGNYIDLLNTEMCNAATKYYDEFFTIDPYLVNTHPTNDGI